MKKRKIIKIDEEKCNGCGQCIPNCPEGALQVIDGKARIISDLFCDGLGACIGYCPQGAISIEERDAEPYNEKKVMENIIRQGKKVIKEHLIHLREHRQNEYLKEAMEFLRERNIEVPEGIYDGEGHISGCPGAKVMDFRKNEGISPKTHIAHRGVSALQQWPIQIMLVPPFAPYLDNADLLISADCVPFAYPDFHTHLLEGKILLVGCPKLDDVDFYQEKITQIFKNNHISSVTCVHMEVPCCFGLVNIVKEAISRSGKDIPFREITITIKGEISQ